MEKTIAGVTYVLGPQPAEFAGDDYADCTGCVGNKDPESGLCDKLGLDCLYEARTIWVEKSNG